MITATCPTPATSSTLTPDAEVYMQSITGLPGVKVPEGAFKRMIRFLLASHKMWDQSEAEWRYLSVLRSLDSAYEAEGVSADRLAESDFVEVAPVLMGMIVYWENSQYAWTGFLGGQARRSLHLLETTYLRTV